MKLPLKIITMCHLIQNATAKLLIRFHIKVPGGHKRECQEYAAVMNGGKGRMPQQQSKPGML